MKDPDTMKGYKIVITPRPCHPYELRLTAYLISPSNAQAIVHSGFNPPDTQAEITKLLKWKWPGIPITRDDNLYVIGVDPVSEKDPVYVRKQASSR